MDWDKLNKAIGEMPKTMSIWTAPDEKVVFIGENGSDYQLESALKVLETGAKYTVERIVVGGWSSDVYLKEFSDRRFNSVMFVNVGEPKEVEDKNEYSVYRMPTKGANL